MMVRSPSPIVPDIHMFPRYHFYNRVLMYAGFRVEFSTERYWVVRLTHFQIHCVTCIILGWYDTPYLPFTLLNNISSLKTTLLYPRVSDRIRWAFFPNNSDAFLTFMENLENCAPRPTIKFLFQNIGTPKNRFELAFYHTFLSIMGNFTMVYKPFEKRSYICSQKTIRTKGSLVVAGHMFVQLYRFTKELPLYHTFVLKDRINTISSLYCEVKGYSSSSIEDITKQYDITLWTLIVISSLFAIVVFKFVLNLNPNDLWSYIKCFEIVIKTFLEQDSNVLAKPPNNVLVQIAGIFMLLSSLLLVNIYKSNISHDLIEKKGYKLNQNYDQYQNHYTSIGCFSITFSSKTLPLKFIHERLLLVVNSSVGNIFLKSHPLCLYGLNYLQNKTLDSQEQASLYPNIESIVQKALSEVQFSEDVLRNDLQEKGYRQNLENVIKKQEADLILQDFSECKSVMLYIPKHEGYEMKKKVESLKRKINEGYLKKVVHIRSEENFTGYISFYIPGFVPDFLQKRINGIQQSGVFDWWQKFILHKPSYTYYKDRFEREPTVEGNVQIIFYVLMAGIGCGMISLILENVMVKLGRIKLLIIYTYSLIIIMHNSIKRSLVKLRCALYLTNMNCVRTCKLNFEPFRHRIIKLCKQSGSNTS